MHDISVIVPLYRGGKYIDRLIGMFDECSRKLQESFLGYTVELTFVNDSPDNTIDAEAIRRPLSMQVKVLEPGMHQGIHGSRLYGLKHTNSEFVLFFDQDDHVEHSYFSDQLPHMAGKDGVVCNGTYRSGRLIYDDNRPMALTFDRKTLLEKQGNPLSPGQVLLRRNAIPVEQWARHVLSHNLVDDWLLWFLMASNHCEFGYNPSVLYEHCENDLNSSLNWSEMRASRLELLDALRELDLLSPTELVDLERTTERYSEKYSSYIKLDELLSSVRADDLVNRVRNYVAGKTLAIYGLGIYGERLLSTLRQASCNIAYAIDRQADSLQTTHPNLQLFKASEGMYPAVDLIVVTPTFAYQQVISTSLANMECSILPLDEFLSACLRDG